MERTDIFRIGVIDEELLGFVDSDGIIHRLRWEMSQAVGRVDGAGRVVRNTRHDEREIGSFTPAGRVRSHGLFEGGDLGWVDRDGIVVQAGLILGEEEVGRVVGPAPAAAAAALLLIFLPDVAEAERRGR
ncbi:MAG: hypothetical protein KJZ93_21935 [Caldilineaceae bacterium]|nr:hypothetical protein [Caldilineaceae bacterium]